MAVHADEQGETSMIDWAALSKRPTTGVGKRGAPGFTRVSLLVLIVVLAVLSAAVVFALQGPDDKAERGALDEGATLRTAESRSRPETVATEPRLSW